MEESQKLRVPLSQNFSCPGSLSWRVSLCVSVFVDWRKQRKAVLLQLPSLHPLVPRLGDSSSIDKTYQVLAGQLVTTHFPFS